MVHLTLSARDALKSDRAVVAVGARLDDRLLWFCDVPQANASQRDNPNPGQYNRDPECSHAPFLSCGRAIESAHVAHPRMSHKSGAYRLALSKSFTNAIPYGSIQERTRSLILISPIAAR